MLTKGEDLSKQCLRHYQFSKDEEENAVRM